jgi:uncharacterized protein YodC (DUF2158 family)
MTFTLAGEIARVEVIASGRGIRELRRLKKAYGGTRWHKRKGVATIVFADGRRFAAEVHWYDGHGVGRKEIKIKRLLRELAAP